MADGVIVPIARTGRQRLTVDYFAALDTESEPPHNFEYLCVGQMSD
jgi:hypothetical protein